MASVSPHLLVRLIKVLVCLAVVSGAVSRGQAAPSAGALAPVYWKQRLFFVPYQLNKRDTSLDHIAKVQLLLSRNGASGWYPLQEAKPNVQGFSYHAPADGQYWFALRHIDNKGKPWPNAVVQPQLRIIIDTAKPTLKLSGSLGVAGAIMVRYEALDANLRSASLKVEARTKGGNWTPLQMGTADVNQSDRLVGRAEWSSPFGAKIVELRASISDQAGHSTQAATTVAVAGPSLQMPSENPKSLPKQQDAFAGPQLKSATADPFQTVAKMPAREWPANNQLPRPTPAKALSSVGDVGSSQKASPIFAPPIRNTYTASTGPGESVKTKANLIAGGINSAPELLGQATNSAQQALVGHTPNNTGGWSSPTARSLDSAADRRTVNSRTFDVEYDLQSVGPWGVSKVELWGTHDNGRTWQSYGADPDNRSPARVTVDGAGVYGFRILVDGANGLRAAPPRSGDQPELVVAVDLQPPSAEILSAQLGQGNLAGHLQITWRATDSNLEPRPIGLFYSAYPNGPWSTIAAGLENTGSYTWRLERHVPSQFFVRMETRDMAGNVATYQLPNPVALARPQPTGRLRNVRPVASPYGNR
ncbi:MAG: hypothetical protein GXP26_07715 [Planctomycetes bacterium]|nr:hypothetical protein [Planctomycetota bacterium]